MAIELTRKYIESITLNSQVHLTDTAALEASQSEGRGLQGMEYTVKEITSIKEAGNLCSWVMFKIVNPKQVLYLCAKIIDDVVEVRTYYNPESIIEGSRYDQFISAGNTFMFEFVSKNKKARVISDSDLVSLKYAKEINWTFDFGNGPEDVLFNQKGNIELTGKAKIIPSNNVDKIYLSTISEYLAEKETPEPEMMILEIGSLDLRNQGYSGYSNSKENSRENILFLVGNRINEFEISIVRNTDSKNKVEDLHDFLVLSKLRDQIDSVF